MWSACEHVFHMSVMIQIRNVPEDLHRVLKARAAMEGKSLSDYLLGEIRAVTDKPTMTEMRARLHRLPPVTPSTDPADLIRAERDSR